MGLHQCIGALAGAFARNTAKDKHKQSTIVPGVALCIKFG
jgi:hypothetical protein